MRPDEKSQKNVTMADIAQELGISNVTVSNALAGRSGVGKQLREEILIKAREMGYKSAGEKYLSQKSSGVDIAVIAPERCIKSGGGFYWEAYQYLATELKKYDCYAILDIVSKADETAKRTPRIIEEGKAAGVIMLGMPSLGYLTNICARSLPVVFLGFYVRDFDFDCIVADDFNDMYRLTSYMISLGHRRIAYCGSPDESEELLDRYLGYRKALYEHDIAHDPSLLFRNSVPTDDIELPKAFICDSTENLRSMTARLDKKNIAIPESASVAYYRTGDDTLQRDYTCIKREPRKLAGIAVEALRAKLDGSKGSGRLAVGGRIHAGTTSKSSI